MALSSINPVIKKPDEGGGLMGSIVGGLAGLAGAALAVPTGGASLATIPAAGAIGEQLGAAAGNAISAPNAGGSVPIVQPEETDSRARMSSMMKAPEVQLAAMQNSKNLLSTSDIPDAQNYVDQITQAQAKLKQQLGGNSFLGRA